MSTPPPTAIQLSVVVPAHNEEDNVEPLVLEVEQVFAQLPFACELLYIDDGSTDQTLSRALAAAEGRPWLRVLHRPRRAGQSAAFHAGLRAARGELVGMLDADLQNDPADLPLLLEQLRAAGADWVQGRRVRREDGWWRAFSSWVGRTFRRLVLGDTIRDTGCSCRVFRREVGLQLPLQFAGAHRFMPVYARRLGYMVIERPVRHRDRRAGRPKYGALNRAIPGLVDLIAFRWMFRRLRDVGAEELTAARREEPAPQVVVAPRRSAQTERI
ncbi:MAG: glycosyltransferase [Planctomycetota bacterium]|nr:MAG: glycosyltransferase [Planctomycetota bacterium]